eukprot:CAMPEP_0119493598 /NCGR_PEP_ID=MMETSP1344-20130328/17808_1 /TAXON_ID=236787 /ORGANISM="Florenciella parvula, Strain CCMP2471" /LENGTH=371 /DNA_ID=CAMNT_0007529037 /DNA_START=21 /DNA_END=1136 /DNA_ORIENTATION=+
MSRQKGYEGWGTPDNPMKPTKFQLSTCILPGLLYLVALVLGMYHQVISAIYDGIAYYALYFMIRCVTGLNIKMKRVRINFGFGCGVPTEISISSLKIMNPVGGYIRSETLLDIDRVDLHIDLRTVYEAFRIKKKFWWRHPTVDIPVIQIRGIKLDTEIAPGSPHAKMGEQMLNLWAIMGGKKKKKTPEEIMAARKEADRLRKEREEEEAALKKGLKKKKKDRDDDGDDDGDDVMTFDKLTNKQKNDYEERKKKALGSPVRFRVSSVLISGISLGLADLVNDIMGGDKSLGDCSPALIDKIVITRFDFRNKAVHTKKLLQTLVYKTDLINIIKDLALQIGIAAGDKIDPFMIIYVLNDIFGGLLSMLDMSLV